MGRTGTAHGRALSLGAAVAAVVAVVGLGALQAEGRLIERTMTVNVPVRQDFVGGTASARARCPNGTRVVAGGFKIPLDVRDSYSTHLKLAGQRGWRAGAVNYDDDETSKLTSIAYCGKLRGVNARERTVTIPKQGPDDSPQTVTATCRRGERLAFGGFDYDQGARPGRTNDAYLSEMRRVGKRGWRVGAYNFAGRAPLTAIAYCSKEAPPTTAAEETVTVRAQRTARVKAGCGRAKRVGFAGFRADVTFNKAFVILHALQRTSARTVLATAYNGTGQALGDLTAYAYCARR